MKSEQLAEIAQKSADALKALIAEGEDDILAIVAAATEEAQNQEREKIVVRIGHVITLDLTRNRQTDSISFAVRRKLETETSITDPDQPEFELE
jgi:hypothetical protein